MRCLHHQGQAVHEKLLEMIESEEEGKLSERWKPLTQQDDVTSHRAQIQCTSECVTVTTKQNKSPVNHV
jgi:hypothetical protein